MAPYALLVLVAFQAADYVTFLAMVGSHGLVAEANPIVVALAAHGLGLLTVAKVAAVVLVVIASGLIVRRHPGVARVVLGTGILVGAIGAVSNLVSL